MSPLNYNIDVAQPFEAALKGYQTGLGISQAMQKQQQQELELQQQQLMQRDLAMLASNKNATAQDYASAITKYPKLSEHLNRGWDVLNENQQRTKLNQDVQVYAALNSGRHDVASKLLRDQAAAMRNSGLEQDATMAETMAKFIDMDPQSAKATGGLILSARMGPEKFASTFSTLGQEQRSADKAPGELRKANAEAVIKEAEAAVAPQKNAMDVLNVRSQITDRAARLGLDQDKLTSEMQMKLHEMTKKANTLTDDAKKIVNESTTSAVVADQSAGQMLDLASRLEKTGAGYGSASSAAEWLKQATGNQDGMTAMRQEYTRLRNTQAIKMLPPGPATDKDVTLALKGFPAETADAGSLSGFLRGMAKLQQREAVFENAKAEWVNAVGHMGKPRTDIEIDGVKVPTGSTFVDFARQFLKSKTDQRAAQQNAQTIQGRSYMRFAQPGGQ